MSRSWKAYPPAWARAQTLRARAARWQRRGLLSAGQRAAIEAAYPLEYYRPAWPLRLGLFLFTWLGVGMGSGLFLALAYDYPAVWGLLVAGGCLGLTEAFIRQKKGYYAGVDNALLYCGLGAAVGSGWYLLYQVAPRPPDLLVAAASLPLLLGLGLTLALLGAAVVRYAEPLVTAAAYATALVLLLDVLLATVWGLLLLPFALMAFGGAAYALHQRLRARVDVDYYAPALLVLKVLALVTGYGSGNYLVVREASAALHGFGTSGQIALAPLFYFFTAAIPVLYLALGLRRADRVFLLMGLFTLAFSLFTLRYYRAVLPPEWAATLGGLVLIAGAGTALRYLRPQRHGLTSASDDEPRFLNLETLIVMETTAGPATPAAPDFEFGGGASGGGGATGHF